MTTENPDTLAELDGERGIPGVNVRQPVKRGQRAAMFTLLVVLFGSVIGGGAWFKFVYASQTKKKEERALNMPQEPTKKSFSFPAVAPRRPETAATSNLDALPPTEAGKPAAQVQAATPEEAPGFVDKSAAQLTTKATGKDDRPPAQLAANGGMSSGVSGALDGMLASSKTPSSRAYMMPDRDYLLAKGTTFKCALRTRINSTVPGMSACTVSRDVFSDNGTTVLIPRGSRVASEYRSNVQRGAARIGVLHTQIDIQIGKKGIRVPLDSPGADALGASGVPGWVDDHFWQRFGGAIMLTLIDDFGAAAANSTYNSQNGQNINFGNSAQAAGDVAGRAIENTINIPPTLYVNQGTEITIFVARDLDFSDVYELTTESDEEE